MFVRVNIFKGSPEGMDDATRVARERALPALKQAEGSAGLLILADRATGGSLGITFWRSEEALRASEDMASSVRRETAAEAGEEIVGVERYEVLLDERWDGR